MQRDALTSHCHKQVVSDIMLPRAKTCIFSNYYRPRIAHAMHTENVLKFSNHTTNYSIHITYTMKQCQELRHTQLPKTKTRTFAFARLRATILGDPLGDGMTPDLSTPRRAANVESALLTPPARLSHSNPAALHS